MRPPRVRFTVRWLMIAVAVVGVVLGTIVVGRRLGQARTLYMKQAAFHAYAENLFRKEATAEQATVDEYRRREKEALEQDLPGRETEIEFARTSLELYRSRLEYHARLMEFHSRLKSKYEQTASQPWKTIAPDPPSPEP